MWNKWLKMWRARSWMRKNQGFLPTWHAYLGYKMRLFVAFENGNSVEQVADSSGFDRQLLESWVEVGLAVGHLLRRRTGDVVTAKEMIVCFVRDDHSEVGELLVEMMELHIPSLLHYPQIMQAGERRTFDESQFAKTVASTSALIEDAAFPVLKKWVKKQHCQSIIDIGCGYGGYLLRLAQSDNALKLFGVEKDSSLVESARQLAAQQGVQAVEWMQADFFTENNPWVAEKSGFFDLLMLNNIMYYFAPEHRNDLLARAVSLVRKGGYITMISPLRSESHLLPFSAAFNSFMRAHDNLYDLPSIAEIEERGQQVGLKMVNVQALIREGNWYFCSLQKH